MSQGVNGANRSERRVPTKNEPSPSIKKAGISANIHPPMTFNTMSPASVPTLPSHINGRRYIEPQGAELNPGGAATAEVINIIKRNYNRPYHCWNKIPQPVRDTWFKEFMKKYWWYPENHDTIRCTFELVGYMQLKNLLSQARVNQRRPEWIEKSVWKQLCTDWAIKEPRSKIQLNEKIPLGGSTSSSKGKIRKEIYEQSRQSAIKDTGEENSLQHRTAAEVKVVMDIMGEEFHEKVMKLIESVNQIWIQRVESLEREKEELKGFAQLYCNHWQNYENLNKDASLKGLSGKVIPIDNFSPPPPPHHLDISAFRPPHHPNAAAVQPPPPPPPPTQPKVAAFRPAPPHYHPNISTLPSQPYQLNPSAHQAPPSTSVYGFQEKQSLNKGRVYSIKDDEEEEDDDDDEENDDDDFSEEFSDYSMDALVM